MTEEAGTLRGRARHTPSEDRMAGRGATFWGLKDQARRYVPIAPALAPQRHEATMTLHNWRWLAAPLALMSAGCSVAPKNFRKISDPAPIVRARSVSLGDQLPQQTVVPALIDRLEDKDPVVRLAAHEELKKGTGRTFGFIPWGTDADRAAAVQRWRTWWSQKQASLARFTGRG